MVIKHSRDVADDLQRGQAVWTALPEGVRGAIWGGVGSVGMAIAGRVSNMPAVYIYAASACTFALGALVYARIQEAKRVRPANVSEPQVRSSEQLGGIHQAALLRELREPDDASPSTSALRSDYEEAAAGAFTKEQVFIEAKKPDVKPLANAVGIPPHAFPDGSLLGAIWSSQIRVEMVSNLGGTPGIHIKGVNTTAQPLINVRMIVTDLRLWNANLKRFVTTPDTHGPDAVFIEMEIGKATLHTDAPENFGFIRADHDRLELTGNAIGGMKDVRTHRRGIWRVEYRVGPKEGVASKGSVCFEWPDNSDGKSGMPFPCNCPREEKNIYEAPHG